MAEKVGTSVHGVSPVIKYTTSSTNTSYTITATFWKRQTDTYDAYGGSQSAKLTGSHGTVYGDVDVAKEYAYGSGYTDSRLIAQYTKTYTKTTSTQSYSVTWALVNFEVFHGTSDWENCNTSVSLSITIPALATYSVAYNANNGSGAPGSQTKTYGTALTLSSTVPTRTGYTFKEWNTASNGTGTSYSPGGSYTANAAVTLYAIWIPNTYEVLFNANGGTGAPGTQIKTQDQTLILSNAIPLLSDCDFVSWNTASNGSGTNYSPGGSYTANTGATLYAIWTGKYTSPTLSNLKAVRYNTSTSSDDPGSGTALRLAFNWTKGRLYNRNTSAYEDVLPTITMSYVEHGSSATPQTISVSNSNLNVNQIISSVTFDLNKRYDISVTLAVSGRSSIVASTFLSNSYFPIDISPEGKCIGFGVPAEENTESSHPNGLFKIGMDVSLRDKAGTFQSMFDLVYPVGSYYDTSNASFDPRVSWPGTWEKIEDGRVLIARDSSHTVDGGGETKSYTPAGTVGNHTLTTAEIPAHTHGFTTGDAGKHKHTLGDYKYGANYCASGGRSGMGKNSDANTTVNTSEVAAHHHTGTTNSNTGGGGAHNHGFTGTAASINVMQPYTPVYRWHRTA